MKKGTIDLKNMKYYIRTFGCQMNKNDSERIAGILASEGAKPSRSLEESDLIIINTCAVREKSEEKLYSFLGRLTSLKKRKKVTIGVVGCVAQLPDPSQSPGAASLYVMGEIIDDVPVVGQTVDELKPLVRNPEFPRET